MLAVSAALRSVSVAEYVASLPAGEQEVARHVLLGTFNRYGRPVGFHHAPNGVAPPGRRIEEILCLFADGSYRARVSFLHPQRGWIEKKGEHMMFPDHWTREEVMAAGREAYHHRVDRTLMRWRGQGRGVPIRGHHRNDGPRPATFYPSFRR
jgi:hypothetical protein